MLPKLLSIAVIAERSRVIRYTIQTRFQAHRFPNDKAWRPSAGQHTVGLLHVEDHK